MKAGDLLWVTSTKDGKDEARPAVVIEMRDPLALVVTGTGTLRTDIPHVAVSERERFGMRFGLRKPTYFYVSGLEVVCPAQVKSELGQCLARRFFQIEELLTTDARDRAWTASGAKAEQSEAVIDPP